MGGRRRQSAAAGGGGSGGAREPDRCSRPRQWRHCPPDLRGPERQQHRGRVHREGDRAARPGQELRVQQVHHPPRPLRCAALPLSPNLTLTLTLTLGLEWIWVRVKVGSGVRVRTRLPRKGASSATGPSPTSTSPVRGQC
eukprot:483038-Prorocentrum_minimum.AAC.1